MQQVNECIPQTECGQKTSHPKNNMYNVIPSIGSSKNGKNRLYDLGMHIQVTKPQRKARKYLPQVVATSTGGRPEIREGYIWGRLWGASHVLFLDLGDGCSFAL